MKKKTIKIIAIIAVCSAVGIFAFIVFADYFLPLGGNRFVEDYEFSCSKDELLKAIHIFKIHNPEFVVPQEILDNNKRLGSGLRGDSGVSCWNPWASDHRYEYDYEYVLYFKSDNETMSFFVREHWWETQKIQLYLSTISKSPGFNSFLEVNKDIYGSENRKVKRDFEEQFLDKIGIEYDKKGNGAPILYHYLGPFFKRLNHSRYSSPTPGRDN